MQYVHPLVLAELLNEVDEPPPPPRPALGGSDRRPPEDSNPCAQVIRFPIERVRRRDVVKDSPGEIDSPPNPPAEERSEADAAKSDSLWPAWMLKTLSGRYHAPALPKVSQTGLTA